VASLPYNERLPTEDFACSKLVGQDKWMTGVLFSLDTKWENGLLVWMRRPETTSEWFVDTVSMYVPSVLELDEVIHMRELLDI